MQNVVSKVSGTSALAQVMAVPNLHKPVRLPTFPALERTAVLSFTDTSALGVPGGKSSPAVLVKDPAYPLWTQQVFPAIAESMWGSYERTQAPTTIPVLGARPLTVPFPPAPRNCGAFLTTSTPVPLVRHLGNIYWCLGGETTTGELAYRPAVEVELVDADEVVSMTVFWEFLSADGEVRVEEEFFSGAASYLHPTAVSSLGVSDFAVRPTSILLRTKLDNAVSLIRAGLTTTSASGTLSEYELVSPNARPVAVSRLYPYTRTPEEYQSVCWENTRATAVACLFKNVTSVMNKEGTVQAARVPKRTFPLLRPLGWNFGSVHPRDRYFGALENGFYAYTLSDASSEVFRDCADQSVGTGPLPATFFDFGLIEYGTVISFEDLDVGSASTLAVTLDRHIEFRTTSRLFPTDFSKLRLEEYHSSQMALADMGTMFENPTHLAAIARMAMTAAKAAWPMVRPMVISAASNLAGKVLKKADALAGDMRQASLTKPRGARPQRKPAKAAKQGRKK